jgi:flagellar hook-associated protein 1 FlgK
MLSGGTLSAQFTIRDFEAPAQQARLDALARDLAERLGPSGPDATLAPADPGLFTDAGISFDALNEVGFAGRISINELVRHDTGGSWRLRDGLGAVTPGDVGDARLLQGMSAALLETTVPGSGTLSPVARNFADRAAEFSAGASAFRFREENNKTYLGAQNTALRERELSQGVDTDQELQRLMQIEQHYAANARVMSVVDELMQRLLAI